MNLTKEKVEKIMPFLKWPGGKRWFISKYHHFFPPNYKKYIEPFLGGGSVFFDIQPQNAIISDINADLINLYKSMCDKPGELRDLLLEHQNKHSDHYYYLVRSSDPKNELESAARFLYLNRTCFNGMYRVNKNGQFNVPKGTKNNFIYDVGMFESYALILKNAAIEAVDFATTIKKAGKDDLIFVDPPYTITHNQNCFIKYNEKLFTWNDQLRLAQSLSKAKNRGSIILATNANYKELRDLYQGYGFYTHVLNRYSSISGKSECRKIQEELLITTISNLEG